MALFRPHGVIGERLVVIANPESKRWKLFSAEVEQFISETGAQLEVELVKRLQRLRQGPRHLMVHHLDVPLDALGQGRLKLGHDPADGPGVVADPLQCNFQTQDRGHVAEMAGAGRVPNDERVGSVVDPPHAPVHSPVTEDDVVGQLDVPVQEGPHRIAHLVFHDAGGLPDVPPHVLEVRFEPQLVAGSPGE